MTREMPSNPEHPWEMQPEVAQAVVARRPLVGLETAVLTHGLPRESWRTLATRWHGLGAAPPWLDADAPLHLAAVRAMSEAVAAGGAVPAITAVLDGVARIGLTADQLARLAADRGACKLAARDLAVAMARRASGGTTVSASLALCAGAAIRVFATGGIGGVHRGWNDRPDVSADLPALARHPICVVCAGAKSILDLPATVEALETLSIPVIGWRCDAWPRFVLPPDPSLPVATRCDDAQEIASICREHWTLGGGAVLVVQPVDPADAVEDPSSSGPSGGAPVDATGPAVTPELLGRLAEATRGRSLRANASLLRANARLAAEIAGAVASSGNRT